MSLIYTVDGPSVGGKRQRHGLYLGGKVEAKSRAQLERWGVTHILNVTPEKEAGVKSGVANFFESSRAFTYKRIPVYDASTSDLLSHADAAVSFISSGLCHGSVLVHCQRGVSRSVTCILFYLMRRAGMTLESALRLVKQSRPEADPIPAFMTQLKEYETKCRQLGVIHQERSEPNKKRKELEPSNEERDAKRPIGPAIGPTTREKPVIGPTIGPTRQVSSKYEKKSPNIGPSIGPQRNASTEAEKPLVGPQLPSQEDEYTESSSKPTIGSDSSPGKPVVRDAIIGPALPPTAGK